MKKRINILSIVLCIVIAALAFVGCSPAGAPDHSVTNPQYAVSVESLESVLDDFINTVGDDRTSFTQAEENAAIYLQARLTEYGYTDAALQTFDTTENNTEVTGHNVVAYYRTSNRTADTKNVIIGAYFDNRYKAAYKGAAVYKSQGALANGTGVATLLAIAEYFQTEKPQYDFDVTIAFFGGSFVTDVGAREFYKSGMTHAERANTVLMVELQRLGVDHVYAYSDARQTKREPFFDGVAAKYGLDVYKITQKTPLITDATAYEGIPYYQWAHSGVFGLFFDSGIPTLNLIGANWETINMTDAESSKHPNIAYTDRDNLETLKRLHPQYAQKMATAATLVIGSLNSADFLNVMNYDRAHFPNTDVLTKNWIWHLVVLGIVIIFVAAFMAINAHLGKKYPIVATASAPRRMKMAVFGMDYEDKNSSDIFIDIKGATPLDDIFPGVPNNDKSARADNPFDEIFPMLFDEPFEEHTGNPVNDVAEQKPFDEKSDLANTEQREVAQFDAKQSDGEQAETDENTVEAPTEQSEVKADSAQQSAAPQAKTQQKSVKPAAKSGTTKRRTVSAGKSVGAKSGRSGKAASGDKHSDDGNAQDGE